MHEAFCWIFKEARQAMTYLILSIQCDKCAKIIDGLTETFHNMGEDIGDICDKCYERGNY